MRRACHLWKGPVTMTGVRLASQIIIVSDQSRQVTRPFEVQQVTLKKLGCIVPGAGSGPSTLVQRGGVVGVVRVGDVVVAGAGARGVVGTVLVTVLGTVLVMTLVTTAG